MSSSLHFVTGEPLTPELVAPLLQLRLRERCVILKGPLDSLAYHFALIDDLDARVHQVSDAQRRPV